MIILLAGAAILLWTGEDIQWIMRAMLTAAIAACTTVGIEILKSK
jgi:hypothetical protein